MGKQIMLVNVHEDETRIALVENNLLVGLHVQQTDRERKVGNIYRGRVVKINPAFQAAFIDYGESRNGFLSISDVNFNLHRPKDGEKGRPKIQNVLREGQSVMVQILKEGMSNKGSALTTFISLAGRYMVMSPNSERSGVSRKIEDADTRRRLKDIMEALTGGEDLGVIIRTAGIDQPVSELKRDLESLRKTWKGIQSRYDKEKKPTLLHQEASPIVRVLRDYFTDNVQEVWVDDAEGFQEALGYFKSTLPKFQKRLKLYVGDKSLFSAYRIEEQIEALDSAKVPLKSGGSLIIESTEALVSIDVNSGRSNQAQDIEETALRTNMEAATEVARQLRLRNLGGLIVIDFIDMMQAKNRKQIEKTVADALKDDKARTTIGSISQFGLLELSRQRIDMELSRGLRVQCPNCGGTGHIPTVNSSANNVLRKIRELAATGRYDEIHGSLPLESANFLLNEKREALRDLELEFEITLHLEADADLPAGHPISLHGAKGDQAEDEAPGERTPERRSDAAQESTEDAGDGGTRRRRRRRRRRRGEDGSGQEAESFGDSDRGGSDRGQERPPMAAANALDEELDVDSLESDDNGLSELVEGEHEFDAPHAAIHAEPGVMERRPVREPPAPVPARDNGQGAGLLFRSEHIVTDPEALEKMPPPIIRSNPFRELAGSIEPNTVIFDSANLYGGGGLTAPAKAAPKGKPKRGAKAAKAEAAPAVEAVEEAAAPAPEPEAPADGKDGDAAAPAKRKRRRGRRRGSGDASAAEQARTETTAEAPADAESEADMPSPAADEPEDAQPPAAAASNDDFYDPAYAVDEETGLPDNFGNLKEPPPQLAKSAEQKRPRRGRGRPGAKAQSGGGQARRSGSSGNGGSAKGDGAQRRSRPRRGRGRGGRRPGEGSSSAAG